MAFLLIALLCSCFCAASDGRSNPAQIYELVTFFNGEMKMARAFLEEESCLTLQFVGHVVQEELEGSVLRLMCDAFFTEGKLKEMCRRLSFSPLFGAVKDKNLVFVRWLIEHGVPLGMRDQEGKEACDYLPAPEYQDASWQPIVDLLAADRADS
jgi:hypothetical protein